jgi:hypothetical protein
MFETKPDIVLRSPFSLLLVLCLSMMLPACAQSATPTPTALSSNQKTQLISRLQAAKKQDWESALEPDVAPVTAGDFLVQMNKANRVIKELTHGFDVSPQEITDALWIPPKSISPQERQRLIQELQEAWREDDHNEQKMLNDLSYSMDFPADTATFELQKERVNDVLKDLEIDEGVHWSTIREALYVPPAPY